MATVKDVVTQTNRRIGRPPATDSRATRAALIISARKNFSLVGYANATNAAIAEEVGVTAGTIHHHFGGKQNLYAEVALDAAGLVLEKITAATDPTLSFPDNLKRAIAATAASNAQHPYLAHFAVGVSDEAARHPELREVSRAFHRTLDSFYDRLIADALRSGAVRPGIEATALKDVVEVLRIAAARLAIFVGAGTARHRRVLVALNLLIDGELFSR